MRPDRDRGPETREEPSNPGTEAQEQEPDIGPGVHPDADQDATPDDTSPGGRP